MSPLRQSLNYHRSACDYTAIVVNISVLFLIVTMCIFCFVCICRTQHSNFNSEGFWKVEGEWKVVESGRELPFLLAERDKIRHKVPFVFFTLFWSFYGIFSSVVFRANVFM